MNSRIGLFPFTFSLVVYNSFNQLFENSPSLNNNLQWLNSSFNIKKSLEQPLNQLETHQNATSNTSVNDESINLPECELILNELVDIVCEEEATLAGIKRQCELTLNELVDRVLVECESAKHIQTNISISSSIHKKTGIL